MSHALCSMRNDLDQKTTFPGLSSNINYVKNEIASVKKGKGRGCRIAGLVQVQVRRWGLGVFPVLFRFNLGLGADVIFDVIR